MATTRRQIATKVDMESLQHLLDEYGNVKSFADDYKKKADKYSTELKELMLEGKLDEVKTADFVGKVTVKENEDFNELQAIEILRETLSEEDFEKVVKTREYIDDDALETLVYNKRVDVSILAPCRTPKAPTVTLRLTKVKKK